MRNHSQILRAGNVRAILRARGVPASTIQAWICRNSIPAREWHWLAENGHTTLEELAVAAARKKRKKRKKSRSHGPSYPVSSAQAVSQSGAPYDGTVGSDR